MRLIPNVLDRKGWKVHQVWALDWFENKVREESRIQDFLKGLDVPMPDVKQEKDQKVASKQEIEADNPPVFKIDDRGMNRVQSNPGDTFNRPRDLGREDTSPLDSMDLESVSPSFKVSQKEDQLDIKDKMSPLQTEIEKLNQEGKEGSSIQLIPYQAYPVERIFETNEFKNRFNEDVKLAQAIVDVEAPIHDLTLKRKILEHYDRVKMTRATDEYLTSVIKKVKTKKRNEEGAYFYWGQIDYRRYKVFRKQEKPDLSSVSLIEMSNGLNTVVPIQGDISVEEVYKQFSKILGYSRTTDAMIAYYEKALNVLKRQKLITIKKGKISRMDKK